MSKVSQEQAIATKLNQMQVGDSGVVADVESHSFSDNEGLFNITRRLKELGFVKGEQVRILHKGYFGGEPLAVRIGQSTFALRNFEAALVGITYSGKAGA